MNSSE
jgi:hypothetical protein